MPDLRSLGPNELEAGELVDMTFDAVRGSLTPNAYSYGGLIAHGLAGQHLWDAGQTTWMSPASANAAVAGLWRGDRLGAGADATYLDGSTDATMTVWFEGEVWLDAASTESFGLAADAVAFVDLAQPGTTTFSRVVANSNPASPTTAAVATPVTGWYPIRVGFANNDGMLSFAFTHSDTAAGPQLAWSRDRLRARGSELSGALRTVFFRQILGGGDVNRLPISHVDDGTLLQATFPDPALQGAPASNDNWSARYAAQVYIAQPGSYTLKVTSDDGHELWFGGQTKSPNWAFNSPTPGTSSTVTATLAAGWNDLIVDYNQLTSNRKLAVQLTGGQLTAEIPRTLLRPVEPAFDRLAFGADDGSHLAQDNGGPNNPATAVMVVGAYAGTTQEMVTAIDVDYEVNSPHWNELRIDLESPTKRVNIASGNGVPNGDSLGQTSIPAGTGGQLGMLLGGPASGTWKLHVYDVQDSGNTGDSTLKSVRLTLHISGGPDKIARSASWTSQVIDATSNVIAIDGITWQARVPDGAGVQVRLRGCQQASCSDGPAWPGPVTSGMPFAIVPARYLQLRVDLTSDGSHEPELQSLTVPFRRT
jgi:subtilisin-like proprotein convertase family protein